MRLTSRFEKEINTSFHIRLCFIRGVGRRLILYFISGFVSLEVWDGKDKAVEDIKISNHRN